MATTIDDLPLELLRFSFEFLGFRDLVQCRDVSCRFRLASDTCKPVHTLVVCEKDNSLRSKKFDKPTSQLWFADHQRRPEIDFECSVTYACLSSLRSIYNFKSTVKRIYIEIFTKRQANFVNRLYQLEHLNIGSCEPDLYSVKCANLRTFKITRGHGMFNLAAAPQLVALKCHKLNQIDRLNAKQIKHLEVELVRRPDEMNVFSNLEYLEFTLNSRQTIDQDILYRLTNLTTLRIYRSHRRSSYDPNDQHPLDLIDFVVYAIRQKRALARTHLKLYFEGVELVDERVVDLIFSCSNSFQFQLLNYAHLVSYLPCAIQFNYSLFEHVYPNTILDDLFKKFHFISSVQANGPIKNRLLFAWFLNNLNHLSSLKLVNTSLDQSFFDNMLPRLGGKLKQLKIMTRNAKQTVDLSSLVPKMRRLQSLQTDCLRCPRSFKLPIRLFKRNERFQWFIYEDGKIVIRIDRQTNQNGVPVYCVGYLDFDQMMSDQTAVATFDGHVELKMKRLDPLYDHIKHSDTWSHASLKMSAFFKKKRRTTCRIV